MTQQRWAVVALSSGFLAAVTLVLPWLTISGRSRSTIDLIGSAGALDVLNGFWKALVITGWFLFPATVAAAMLVAASGRLRIAAWLVLPLAVLLAVLVVGLRLLLGEGTIAWGAWLTGLFAAAATGSAIMVLFGERTLS
ncbi:MAG: hypothetical protein HKN94_16080 [Acidimicrobiales bacterium]|nr:hypothetical protein [Acidimicrobiales bacterium]RZV46556.1 MAG: hypothetical protein EX269_06980 [Acidimicrobiales bacterium]